MTQLVDPHGGALVDLVVGKDRASESRAASREWPSWTLTPQQVCDLEMLATGAFSPLRRFMGRDDIARVCAAMRLGDDTLWPMPITLDVSREFAAQAAVGTWIALRDVEGVLLAAMQVDDVWEPDRVAEARAVFGSDDRAHPGVAHYLDDARPMRMSGPLEVVELPHHFDFGELRLTPAKVREEFARLGWSRVVAFQTRNPMHRAHVELTLHAAREHETNLLIHPVVGMTKPGDVDHYTRVRCYRAVMPHYPAHLATLSLLPLAMRMAGPREAVWHAIIRKNHGCTHLIVGRDHAGPGKRPDGKPWYGPYDAQALLREHEAELGVTMVPFMEMVFVEEDDAYRPVDKLPDGARTRSISGTQLRERLADGREIPAWFTYPEVAVELARTHPPRARQGFVVFFTGLSGAGKSTIANALRVKLLELGGRSVTLLDGDIVRTNLSSELGFSREHRDLNISRIGFVAAEIAKAGGIALCAPIAPYDATRKHVRALVHSTGPSGFTLVHVATPLDVCEQRDRKGLYAKARAGIVKQFTGISDPYEAPTDAELAIDTTDTTPEQAAETILTHLTREGYLA